jgi:hypothetical protein
MVLASLVLQDMYGKFAGTSEDTAQSEFAVSGESVPAAAPVEAAIRG